MKIFLIANCIYLPIETVSGACKQKYIAGSITGNLFPEQIFTEEEIIEEHKGSTYPLVTVENLHELTEKWGKR